MEKQVFNPILPSWEYVPDVEPRVFGERLYLYGSHDQFNGKDFCLNDYVCWSAPLSRLSEWRYEGIIYRKIQDPRNADGKMHMCAPDCVKGVDGRYYLYYQLHALQCTSVAVADQPTGPFEFYGYVCHPDGTPWGEKRGDSFIFDPAVLVDEGKAYLYAGFSTTGLFKAVLNLRGNKVDEAVCLHLENDMKTVRWTEHPIVPGSKKAKGTKYEGHSFYEASSIRKIGEKYYFVYSSELSHELCYAASDYPDRDFCFGGTLVSIGDIGYKGNDRPLNYLGNTHGGMTEINGKWYIFYHRQTNKIKCSRQVCAERLYIQPDGSIQQVEMTSCGLNDGPLQASGKYEARIACNLNGRNGIIKSDDAYKKDRENQYPYFTQSGEDREGNGDQYIANMQDGAWAGFKYFDFDGSEKTIKLLVRGNAEGVMKVSTERQDNVISLLQIIPESDWNEVTAHISCDRKNVALCFLFEGKGSLDFKRFEII